MIQDFKAKRRSVALKERSASQRRAAARRLNALRENWPNIEGASEAELKRRTLTNLYNNRPA